jgi:hypothetical protein
MKKDEKKCPTSELMEHLFCPSRKERKGLGHNETRRHTLIDILRGILFYLVFGPTTLSNPRSVYVEIEQVGPRFDLRNGIVTHSRFSQLEYQYTVFSSRSQGKSGRCVEIKLRLQRINYNLDTLLDTSQHNPNSRTV